jgi:hypothetical protein
MSPLTTFLCVLFLTTQARRMKQGHGELLAGNWTNELGSQVTLEPDEYGFLNGVYRTAVVSNEDRQKELPPPTALYGTYRETGDGLLVTFNVQWRFEDSEAPGEHKSSVATWAGKLFFERRDQFLTTWLLVGDAPQAKLWQNVLINQDTFTRVSPRGERV